MTKKIHSLFILLLMISFHSSLFANDVKQGSYSGAKTANHPAWFKDSFLDLEEDIADAAEQNKRLVVYFWQEGCPYCSQLWEDNFSDTKLEKSFRKNFEIVALNMWGDREVVSVGGNDYSEKSFAEALGIQYTPTLLFFNENKKVVHQLNGYVPPDSFQVSLNYVSGKHEQNSSFGAYSSANSKTPLESPNKLYQEDFYDQENVNLDRSKALADKYLAVYFEAKECENCKLLHEKTLQDQTTRKLAKQFKSIQFDRFASNEIITPSGTATTPKSWADSLGISYLPALVFFDHKGKEVMRIDAQMRTFHIQSVFDYVLTGAYKNQLNFQRYISARADKIREQGIDVDIFAY